MPNWLQYNGVKRTEIAAPRPNRQSDDYSARRGSECDTCRHWTGAECLDHPDYRDCPALGIRFRKLDHRDFKPSIRSQRRTP